MYLVLERNGMDDLPLGIFPTLDAARDYCESYEPGGDDGKPWNPDRDRVCDVMGLDASTPMNLTILAFNSDGKPTDMAVVKSLDGEPLEN